MNNITTLREMLEKQNAILIKDLSENPGLDEWQQMGEPKVLILADKSDNYELYDEMGYGYLYLVQNGKIVSWGHNFVQSPDMQIIGLSSCYGYDPSVLLKRLPWYIVDTKERKED